MFTLSDLEFAIYKGIEYLQSITNNRGGIPNHLPDDPAGAWTTSEVLYTVCEIDSLNQFRDEKWLAKLFDFVIATKQVDGGWPIISGFSTTVSTATATMAVSSYIKRAEISGLPAPKRLAQKSVSSGFNWLQKQQNLDGGWGLAFISEEMTSSRVYSTAFAMKAIAATSKNLLLPNRKTNKFHSILKKGGEYIYHHQNRDGGWPLLPDEGSSVASTSLAIGAINKYTYNDFQTNLLSRGLSYIHTNYLQKNCEINVFTEKIGAEPFTIDIFHNVPFDILNIFVSFRILTQDTWTLVKWFLDNQESDGSWFLNCFTTGKKWPAVTWVTAEAILALSKLHKIFSASNSEFYIKSLIGS